MKRRLTEEPIIEIQGQVSGRRDRPAVSAPPSRLATTSTSALPSAHDRRDYPLVQEFLPRLLHPRRCMVAPGQPPCGNGAPR